jgi:hypothetical protein
VLCGAPYGHPHGSTRQVLSITLLMEEEAWESSAELDGHPHSYAAT